MRYKAKKKEEGKMLVDAVWVGIPNKLGFTTADLVLLGYLNLEILQLPQVP